MLKIGGISLKTLAGFACALFFCSLVGHILFRMEWPTLDGLRLLDAQLTGETGSEFRAQFLLKKPVKYNVILEHPDMVGNPWDEIFREIRKSGGKDLFVDWQITDGNVVVAQGSWRDDPAREGLGPQLRLGDLDLEKVPLGRTYEVRLTVGPNLKAALLARPRFTITAHGAEFKKVHYWRTMYTFEAVFYSAIALFCFLMTWLGYRRDRGINKGPTVQNR